MKISLVLVTHYSAEEAHAAIASFRREVSACGASGEVVVVDHSGDATQEARLRGLAPDRLLVRPNRGYAAGLNSGIAASDGEILLLANPDVELGEGALAGLLAALAGGWDIVGPLFHHGPWLFPPADLQTPRAELARWLATLRPSVWRRHMRRETRRWWRVWSARRPVVSKMLSGALLATHRRAAQRVGAWDEDYFLYFEETDWLRRANRAGLRIAQVPAARVRHAWGHSAHPTTHGQIFARSKRRFFARCYGAPGRCLTSLPALRPWSRPPLGKETRAALGAARWLASPSPWGFPAAWGEGITAAGLETGLAELGGDASRGTAAATVIAWMPGPGREEFDLYRVAGRANGNGPGG